MTHNHDSSYRTSFIFALILHLILFTFLFIKFTNNKSMGFSFSGTVINVTAINEKDFDNKTRKKVGPKAAIKIKKTTLKPVAKKPIKKRSLPVKPNNKKLHALLKKNMLKERERELEELKKERQKHQQELLEEKELELQKKMQEELVTEEHGRQLSGTANKHVALITQAISSYWHEPSGVGFGEQCILLIEIAPDGTVLDTQIFNSSGNELLERSAKAAVLKASPLPVLEDSELFEKERKIKLKFSSKGIVTN